MPRPKAGAIKGKVRHYSVGAIIKDGDRYLLIDRNIPPYGFAGIAGHVDMGEEPEMAIKREIQEESGLTAGKCGLLFEEYVGWNRCARGVVGHYWHVYACAASGELHRSMREAKSIGWYTADAIKELQLEPVWRHWFEKSGIL